jgi:site-specific DNA recombinase
VQKLLGDKIYKAHELTYRPITGEIITKKSGKIYIYYRCARYTAKDHPRDRLREEQIDEQIIALFDRIRQPEVVQKWFRTALLAWSGHHHEQSRSRARDVQKQMDEVRKQQERLLNLHLSAALDDQAYNAKSVELRDRIALLTLELEAADRKKDERADLAAKVFELSQNLKKKWITADYSEKRRLMEMICLNIVLKSKTLCISTRKPFNALIEGLSVSGSGVYWTKFDHSLKQIPLGSSHGTDAVESHFEWSMWELNSENWLCL